jgi:hypothetical protein
VELCLQSLKFPKADRKDFGKKYAIKATMCGFSQTSPALTRPKESWGAVIAPSVSSYDPKNVTQIIKYQKK